MPQKILMPALSPTMTEGKLAKWLKKQGDKVSPGDPIAEIETDKATMEVEAVDEGTLGRILVAEGTENVAVNSPIALLLEEGEDASALDKTSDDAKPEAAPAVKKAEAQRTEAAKAEAPKAEPKQAEAKDAEAEAAAPKVADKGTPAKPATLHAASADSAPPPSATNGKRLFASPLARRLARESGIDIAQIAGSGPHGRVVRTDIEAAKAKGIGTGRGPEHRPVRCRRLRHRSRASFRP
jgi:pyruvate dehydrogenase E2 component (dihydrolipoamide acetyltransferase)